MCGRFFVDENMIHEILKITRYVDARLRGNPIQGDIFPSQRAPVIRGEQTDLAAELFVWGFPGFQGKKVIFNARSESAMEKRMFQSSMEQRRCVIPARGFYEWDKDKNKFTFTRENREVLYLAGCYHRLEGEERFVILTAEANASMKPVHHRMPLILEREELEDWMFHKERALELLSRKSTELKSEGEYMQERLPGL